MMQHQFSVARGVLGFVLLTLLAAPAWGGLREIKTRHYEMHTDLPDGIARDFAERLDAMYDEYARRLSDFPPPKSVKNLPVYLFQKQEDYVAFTKSPNTGGVFKPGPQTFLASFLEGQGLEEMRHTLQHECDEIWAEQKLYFESTGGALDDIVCAASSDTTLRTQFYKINNEVEHETLFDLSPNGHHHRIDMGGLR